MSFIENWSEYDQKKQPTPFPTVAEAVEYFKSDKGFSYSTIKRWIKDSGEYEIQHGLIYPLGSVQNDQNEKNFEQ